jgi:hypothetical protein
MGKERLQDLSKDDKIVLKWTFKTQDEGAEPLMIKLRTETGSGVLQML